MDYTYQLLREGKGKINLAKYENVTLIMGNTGSGKTTLTQFIAGDNTKLFSQEIGEDSGEYIIIDADEKISRNSTIISKTIFPDIVVNDENGAVFVDCPGFSDTRNASIDIANNYFLHEVANQVKQVKFVFAVNYHALKEGVDRINFLKLLTHATNFLKEIDTMSPSISLVVTKVDNIQVKKGKTYQLVPDKTIINNIASFLRGAKHSLKVLSDGSDNKEFYQNAESLVDTFLTSNNGTFSRIGLFRRPEEEGVLSEMPLLQEEKKVLEKMIYENTIFVPAQKEYFGYSLSAESQNHVSELVETINHQISSNFSNIEENLSSVLEIKDNQSTRQLIHFYQWLIENFDEHWKPLEENPTVGSIIDRLQKLLSATDVSSEIVDANINDINEKEHFLNFLETVSEKKFRLDYNQWYIQISSLRERLKTLLDVYTLLEEFYLRLSSYNVQSMSNRSIWKTTSQIADWIDSPEMPQVQELSPILNTLYNNQDNNVLQTLIDRLQNYRLDDRKLKLIESFIAVTDPKNNNATGVIRQNILLVAGNFLKFTDVKWENMYDIVLLFSTTKLFVDRDLTNVCQQCTIIIVSPVWEVIGTRKIILDGKPGVANNFHRWTYMDGNPGQPGEAGGNFLGIGDHFINSENLFISANGGKGGPGTNGRNGDDGWNGSNGDLSSISLSVGDTKYLITAAYNSWYTDYYAPGWPGGPGKDGGDGGVGGFGGIKGKVMVIGSSEPPRVRVVARDGERGEDGQGGLGGRGGKHGNGKKGKYGYHLVLFLPVYWGWKDVHTVYSTERAASGQRGRTGMSRSGLSAPRKSALNRFEIPHIFNYYQNYISLMDKVCHFRVNKDYIPVCNESFDHKVWTESVKTFLSDVHPNSRQKRHLPTSIRVASEEASKTPMNELRVPGKLPFLRSGMIESKEQITGSEQPPHLTTGDQLLAPSFHENLILMDMLVRKYMTDQKKKYSAVSSSRMDFQDNEYAHNLAYSYYKPSK